MSNRTPWQTVLATPAAGDHVAQLYQDDAFLVKTVVAYCRSAFSAGEAAIVIATPDHRAAFGQGLAALGMDVESLAARRQYAALDAEACLASFMEAGTPNRDGFFATIGAHIDAARSAGYAHVRAYGEMVEVLRAGNFTAALRLEELWNDLIEVYGLSLLCSYRVNVFDGRAWRQVLPQIGERHSHLLSVEDPEALDRAVGRAFFDVFGADADAVVLRQLCESAVRPQATMPAAQVALVNLCELISPLAGEVLAATERHYHQRNGERRGRLVGSGW